MRTYYFTEMPYPDLPPAESCDSARVTLPNRVCDPMVSSKLYNRYLTEWEFADAEGLETIGTLDGIAHPLMALINKLFQGLSPHEKAKQ